MGVLRLFNGFYEGFPDLVADMYARTLVIYSHQRDLQTAQDLLHTVQLFFLRCLPQVDCVLQKFRYADTPDLRRGVVSYGSRPAEWIEEHGVKYALDLRLNQDASFYPDTRLLRAWLLQNSRGLRVLNMFAYTGSLGVASLAGGALQVHQVDLKSKYLEIARRSIALNEAPRGEMSLEAADFFSRVAFYKRQGTLFDLAILDAPFFSTTKKGSVDLAGQVVRLVNKLRPLVAHDGRLVVVNNALFLSGNEFFQSMQSLCTGGYLRIQQIIPIPEDITGDPTTVVREPPADPAPFNHPTKILVMGVERK
jgi:23S rRNA (cytosine1962-C5)-methyltransferase